MSSSVLNPRGIRGLGEVMGLLPFGVLSQNAVGHLRARCDISYVDWQTKDYNPTTLIVITSVIISVTYSVTHNFNDLYKRSSICNANRIATHSDIMQISKY